MQSLETFDIRNFTDRLEPANGKHRYICPACNGGNLTIDPKDGAYQCWNGCTTSEIREAIRPLKQALAEANGGDRPVRQQRKPASTNSKPQDRAKSDRIPSAPLPESIALIESVGTKEPPFSTTDLRGWQREQVYQYGPDLRVVRYEKDDPTKPKGREKTFRQWHQSEGRWVMGKGDRPWPAYRIDEAIAGAKADRTKNAILLVEGEQCVDRLRDLAGLAAITLQGSEWRNPAPLVDRLSEIKDSVLIIWPDNDTTGGNKAKSIASYANLNGLACLVIDPLEICPDLPDKGDVVDVLDRMSVPEFIRRLESEIHRAAEAQRMRDRENDPAYQLRLEVADYLSETDTYAKVLKARDICSNHGLPKQELGRLCDDLLAAQRRSSEPPRLLSIAELYAMETAAVDYLVDGWIGARSSNLISGMPGSGKTLLALDLAYEVATGGKFLGAECRKGKVMIICPDMRLQQTRSYLDRRDFRDGDPVMVIDTDDGKWTLKDLTTLENWLMHFQPDLVILDSVRALVCNQLSIEEKSTEAGAIIQQVSGLIARYGGASIWIHHDSKNTENKGVGKAAGSTAITGSVDQVMHLAKSSDHPKAVDRHLAIHKSRFTEPGLWEIELNPENNSFIYHGQVGESPEVAQQNQSCGDVVLRILGERPGVWIEGCEIRDRMSTWDQSTVHQAIYRLAGKKKLIESRPTEGRRGKSYRVPADRPAESEALCQGFAPPSPPPSVSPVEPVNNTESIDTQALQTVDNLLDTILDNNLTEPLSTTPVNSPESLPCNASDVQLTDLTTIPGGGGDRPAENRANVPVGEVALVEEPQPIAPAWPPQVGDRVWHSCEYSPQYVGKVLITDVINEGDRTIYLIRHEENGVGGRSSIANLSPLP
jgi:hypothetical protein